MIEKKPKILLIGGGTGGHITPVFEIYLRLRKDHKGTDFRVIGAGTAIERYFFADNSDYKKIITGKFHRFLTWKNILELFYLLFGMFQALYFLLDFRPTIIFSKGGYVAVPLLFWARILRIPYLIHESDVMMGSSNRFGAKGAKKVFVGFPKENYPEISSKKLVFSGQLFDKVEKTGCFDFGFDQKKPVIFITGGSQGSMIINKIIFKMLDQLLDRYNIIHQTGGMGYKMAIEKRSHLSDLHKKSYFIRDFFEIIGDCDLMSAAITTSDLVISRASATTMAEIASVNKPMILIPYKHAAADHQRLNALVLERAKAAVVVTEEKLTAEKFTKEIDGLMSDKKKLEYLAKNARMLFPSDGLEIVCEEIEKYINKRES